MKLPNIAAVVPAYNEEATVGRVVRALRRSRAFSEVIVVSDGSTDRTVEEASRVGARVLSLPRNMGKGRAMRAGVRHTSAQIIAFFDADIIGLRKNHVQALIDPVLHGDVDMHVGFIDRGSVVSKLMEYLPLISGQRVLHRDVFLKIPVAELEGYRVESALNYFYTQRELRIATIKLQGVRIKTKYEKVGAWRALWQYARMWSHVFGAMISMRLRSA